MTTIRRLTSTSMFLMQTKMLGVPVGAFSRKAPNTCWQVANAHTEWGWATRTIFISKGRSWREGDTATGTCGGPAKGAVGLAQLSIPTGHRTCSRARPQRWVKDGSHKQWYSMKVLMLHVRGDPVHGLCITLGCFDSKLHSARNLSNWDQIHFFSHHIVLHLNLLNTHFCSIFLLWLLNTTYTLHLAFVVVRV